MNGQMAAKVVSDSFADYTGIYSSSDEEEEAKNNPKNTFEEESSVMTVSALEGRYARLKNTFHKRFRRQASD